MINIELVDKWQLHFLEEFEQLSANSSDKVLQDLLTPK